VTLPPQLELIGHDLDVAVRRLIARRRRRRTAVRVACLTLTVAATFSAVAVASGIGPDLQLDPSKWTVLHRGEVENGAGYVHAADKVTGTHSLFMVEHDGDLDRYEAFLLHERVVDLGNAAEAESGVRTRTEPGALCTPAQLTRAEVVALATLRTSFSPGTSADATKQPIDDAVFAAFAGTPCRGLAYASEQARLVYAQTQPAAMLMAGAR